MLSREPLARLKASPFHFDTIKTKLRSSMVYKILLLGHSFISHFKRFVKASRPYFNFSLNLDPREVMVQYSSLPGANVQSLRDSRLTDVKDFEPDIVILQIGTNDLADPKCTHDMLVYARKDLVDTLLYTYHVRYVAVLQILHRFPSTVPTKYKVDIVSFNGKVDLSNDLLSKVLLLIDHCRFWRHKGFWGEQQSQTVAPDGVHLSSPFGQKRYFYSLRAVIVSIVWASLPAFKLASHGAFYSPTFAEIQLFLIWLVQDVGHIIILKFSTWHFSINAHSQQLSC